MAAPRCPSYSSDSALAGKLRTCGVVIIVVLCFAYIRLASIVLCRDASTPLAGSQTQKQACCAKCKDPKETLAYKQSFGYFDNIDDEDWVLRQERARRHQHNPSDPASIARAQSSGAMYFLHNYFPIFTCPHQSRVGGLGDGPKWVCDPLQLGRIARERGCLIYSVGSNGQYEFEDGLRTLNGPVCEIHIFDPSNDYSRPGDAQNNNFHYHRWGLHSSYATNQQQQREGWQYKTLKETMEQLGHVNRTIDLFKIDCEECEWTTYKDWLSPDVDIRQVCVETHGVNKYDVKTNDFFDDIQRAGFALFSKEINPYSPGDCLEWSFVKLSKDFFNRTDPLESPSSE